jgi:predicted regulator of Ras-like GTPase activity (Roadblock/LC7/MglB family)
MKQNKPLSLLELQTLLKSINQLGGFEHTLLTDMEGLPIASSLAEQEQSETLSAVVSVIQKISGQISSSLAMAKTAEFVMNDQHGKKLVIRPFTANDSELILSIVVPDNQKPYRRLIGSAIKSIKTSWMY